jgi:hypothetical protein
LAKRAWAHWTQIEKCRHSLQGGYDDLENWLAETAPPKPKRSTNKSGFVYVIGIEGDNSAVKIGFASKIEDRLSTLQTASHHELKVLAVIEGSPKEEKDLHRKFASDHIRGEWFRRTEAIESFVDSIVQGIR